jgi:hypothetical protein
VCRGTRSNASPLGAHDEDRTSRFDCFTRHTPAVILARLHIGVLVVFVGSIMYMHLALCAAVVAATEDCVPLYTAVELRPRFLTGQLRTFMSSACNLTKPLHYLSGAGDNWFSVGSRRQSRSTSYGHYHCLKLHAWIDGFYAAIPSLGIKKREW